MDLHLLHLVLQKDILSVYLEVVFTSDTTDGSYVTNSNGFPNAAAEKKIGVGDPNPDYRAGLGLNVDYQELLFICYV